MFFEIILALSIGSVAHSLKAFDDSCPHLEGVPWIQSPDRPNEEGLWYPIAAQENPVFCPEHFTCPKQVYTKNNASYVWEQFSNEGVQMGVIKLESSDVGLVGELSVGINVFRIQVVDIEYDRWALMYICGNEEGEHLDFEVFFVMSRHRTIDAADMTKAKDTITKFGGHPDELINFNQSGCD